MPTFSVTIAALATAEADNENAARVIADEIARDLAEQAGAGFGGSGHLIHETSVSAVKAGATVDEVTARDACLSVRHDLRGFYILTDAEAEHEDAGNPSAGFDGRTHYQMEADAWAAAAEQAES